MLCSDCLAEGLVTWGDTGVVVYADVGVEQYMQMLA